MNPTTPRTRNVSQGGIARRRSVRLSVLAAASALVLAAAAAPAGAMYYHEGAGSAATSPALVAAPEAGAPIQDDGFDWGDAAIGAAGALLVAAGTGAGLSGRFKPRGAH